MSEDNLIRFPERGQLVAEETAARGSRREGERVDVAESHLKKLRSTKRILKADRAVLARNLGQQLIQLDPTTYKEVARNVLESNNYWAKRKRYIRFPSDPSKRSTPFAASGGAFAGIIQQIIDEKVQRGGNRAQAAAETVFYSLKGTSFQPPSQFLGRERADVKRRDAATLVKAMDKVVAKLGETADLAEYFDLVSKHPICPVGLRQRDPDAPRPLLILDPRIGPNNTEWASEWVLEDEFQNGIPWWAPKCVIGHLYLRVKTQCLALPEQAVAEIKRMCGGEVNEFSWLRDKNNCEGEIQEFAKSEFVQPRTVFHRLPIWLVVLPLLREPVAWLYVSIDNHVDYFQIEQSLQDETYRSYMDKASPCFVHHCGDRIETDATYFCSEWLEDDSFYICPLDGGINVIGYYIDGPAKIFRADFTDPWRIDHLPHWLHEHPVAQLLKLTVDSDAAMALALTPRAFSGVDMRWWSGDRETVFRPAFSDPFTRSTLLRPDTIGAYLLRSLAFAEDGIFEALKSDAVAKEAAIRTVISGDLSKFQTAFDERYGK